jgi:hypothetical protein
LKTIIHCVVVDSRFLKILKELGRFFLENKKLGAIVGGHGYLSVLLCGKRENPALLLLLLHWWGPS